MQTTGFEPDGGHQDPSQANNFFSQAQPGQMQQSQFGTAFVQTGIPPSHPGANGLPYYTVQRVNGNGGNGKGDGVAGPHKHTLDDSDRIKKNSVQRFMLKKDKEEKKTQVSLQTFTRRIYDILMDTSPKGMSNILIAENLPQES